MVIIIPGSPAQYIYTIKPGGSPPGDCDYTSLNAWEAGTRSDLVAQDRINIAEVMGTGNSGTTGLFIQTGWTTDATRYIEIRAASGHEHTGVWNTGKAYISLASYGNWVFDCRVNLRLTKMQIKNVDNPYLLYAGPTGGDVICDRCLLVGTTAANSTRVDVKLVLKNSVHIGGTINTVGTPDVTLYNNTIITPGTTALSKSGGTFVSQNNYISATTCYSGTITKGANDATSNTEATTANLRSIAYSTANFQNVTSGSENLRLVVSQANKLIDNGANLTSSGVTTDIIGTARPQFGGFDIGAFENDTPICWNYTARYRNSNKLFKASGCGAFPKTLRVPSNIDKTTGRMIDDGIEIDPSEYEVV